VRRVATGWESQLTIAVDTVISRHTMLELSQAFFQVAPQTRLRLREEVLSGTLEALVAGLADLAIGVVLESGSSTGLRSRLLGELQFVFAVAPHHPLARAPQPLSDDLLRRHRAVAVADSAVRGDGLTLGLLAGQEVLTVPHMQAKLEAQLRGLGAGFLPEPLARPYLGSGQLVERTVQRPNRIARASYAWREAAARGRALRWWLQQLESPATRQALLERHAVGHGDTRIKRSR